MNHIRKLRNARGMKQSELAKILGVGQNTLSYWERGVYDIDTKSLTTVAEYFGVTTDYLLGLSGESDTAPMVSPAVSSVASKENNSDKIVFSQDSLEDLTQEEVVALEHIVRTFRASRKHKTS